MKITAIIANDSQPEGWEETYDRPEVTNEAQATVFISALVKHYNGSLRPNEEPRRIISVKAEESEPEGRRTYEVTVTAFATVIVENAIDEEHAYDTAREELRCGDLQIDEMSIEQLDEDKIEDAKRHADKVVTAEDIEE